MTRTAGQTYFLLVLSAVVLERLVELTLSVRNARRVRSRGAIEGESRLFYGGMVLTHALFFLSACLEVFVLGRLFIPPLAIVATLIVFLAMALRYWAITALGDRWNTRVLVVPGEPPVASGPYRLVRHPNYLAVIIEFAFLPLVHTAWLTALAFSAVNAALLRARIRHEERALRSAGLYDEMLGSRPGLFPGPER